jgi:tetratricopeptide (TPR) repeat protein
MLDPRSVAALVGLSRLALLERRADDALARLDQALALQPENADALSLRGIYWMQRGEFERAAEVLEQAEALDPNLAMIHFNLGKCYRELGQPTPAEQAFRKAIEVSPEHFEAHGQLSLLELESGRTGAGIRTMLHAIRINPRYIKGYFVLGSHYESVGDWDAAIRVFQSGIQHNRNAFLLRERLCFVYACKRDFSEAFRAACEIATARGLYTDYLRLGSYAAALQQFETAEKAFKTSLDRNPASWEGHYNLAELYMSARMMDQAREHYQAALDKNNGAYVPFNGMGLFVLVVDEDADRAIELLNRALQLAPSRREPQLNLALAYAKKGDFQTAQKFATSVLSTASCGDPLYDQAERLQGTIRIETSTFRALK